MSDCHSWPIDVSNNLSGYFISNLILVTSCDSTGGVICLWLSWTTLNSDEFTLCSGSFDWGVHLPLVSICFLCALVFPYIFLLVDHFEWALIGAIEKHRVDSVLWQFQMGGPFALVYICAIDPVVKLILCSSMAGISAWLTGGVHLPLVSIFSDIFLLDDHFLIFSYKLTILNGFSLTVWEMHSCHFLSSSFEGGILAKVVSSARFELTCCFMLCFTEGLFVLHMKDLKIK